MRILSVSFFILIIDQFTKVLVKGFSLPFLDFYHDGLIAGRSYHVVNNFFTLTLVENPGIAFGINPDPAFKLLFNIISVLVTAGLIVYLFLTKNKNLSTRLSLAIIIGGAAGNLFDRFFYGIIYNYGSFFSGSVVDFLNFRLPTFPLLNKVVGSYVFNIADVAIITGTVFFLYMLRIEKKNSGERKKISSLEQEIAEELS